MRRRIKYETSLEQRLLQEAEKARRRAQHLPPSITREELLKRAREDETVAHMYEWLTSPGLQPPE